MGLYPYRIRESGAYGNGFTRQEGPIKSSLACTSEQDESVVETPRECKPTVKPGQYLFPIDNAYSETPRRNDGIVSI